MRVGWAQSPRKKQWHAFVFFDGYETQSSVCTSAMKTPETTLPKPVTQGMENVCRNCAYGVRAMKKRYRSSTPAPRTGEG